MSRSNSLGQRPVCRNATKSYVNDETRQSVSSVISASTAAVNSVSADTRPRHKESIQRVLKYYVIAVCAGKGRQASMCGPRLGRSRPVAHDDRQSQADDELLLYRSDFFDATVLVSDAIDFCVWASGQSH